MVPLAVTIAEKSEIARNAIQKTYSHVFLDEFQDCTAEQYKLIETCFLGTPARLIAVGDTKQKIMGWAGAVDGIFGTYAADFKAKTLNLYQNFRSAPRLRRMQNAMVRVMDAAAALEDEELVGDEGEIEILRFQDAGEEAAHLANAIGDWIESESIEPAEIAVLVSRQQNLYCRELRAALAERNVPFRQEDETQDLAAEPVASLIVDFLQVVSGRAAPEAYRRLLDIVASDAGDDDEQEHRARSRWHGFVDDARQRIVSSEVNLADKGAVGKLVEELIAAVGRDAVAALSADYAQGDRLNQRIAETVKHISEQLQSGIDLSTALSSFSAERAVRIMSIHKSKGLEFERVIVLGVEEETFWGDIEAERSAYFVAISRAKKRLSLTVCDHRERPKGAKRWDEERTAHAEFLGYAEAYS